MRVRSDAGSTTIAAIVQRQDGSLVRSKSRFDPLSWHHFRAGSPTGRRRFPQKEDSAGSNPSRRTTCPLSPTVEAAPSKCAKVPVRIRERAPRRSLRQAAKGIGFTSRHFRGSNPRGSTAHLAQWQSIRLTCGRREDRNLGCAPVSGDDSAGEEAALIRQYSAGSTPRSPTVDAKG